MSRHVHLIVGPTAVGKTFLSELLATQLPIEIVSADSRQIYRYMDIGTAKPEPQFRQRVMHHFIDIRNPDEYYSAGLFGREARQVIDQIFNHGRIPLVVGGSGFYIKALVDGIFEEPFKDEAVRHELNAQLQKLGLAALYQHLQQIDPIYAKKISPNDRQRILRALEVYQITGKPFSFFHQQKTEPAAFTPIFWGITMERAALYQRINQRVDQMLKNGLIDEVKQLLKMGYAPTLNALNTVGYKEVIQFLQKELDFSTMVEQIKRNTRRYAKRQLTWFRADSRIQWFEIQNKSDFELLAQKIIAQIKAQLR